MTGIATILRADARALPLPDASVDLIVTSPPYFGLRSYQDGGQHYAAQIGSEPTPAEYIAALIECTREWVRVLKPVGSIFVNLGDRYSQRVAARPSSHQDDLFPGRPELAKDWKRDRAAGLARMPYENIIDQQTGQYVPEKSLMMLPERYRIAAVDQLSLINRAVLVWSKPNGLPESVTDRVRRSHEDWVHLVKQPRYYAAVDEIRQPVSGYSRAPGVTRPTPPGQRRRAMADTVNPLGALPGSVWTIATEPLRMPAELGVDHYAAFPTGWPRGLILGWSPPGICTACGEGRRPVAQRASTRRHNDETCEIKRDSPDSKHGYGATTLGIIPDYRITGYVCACAEPTAPTRPAVILDPFGGTGTTALVARALGRHGITVDRSADYCHKIARWRLNDPAQQAKAARRRRPPKTSKPADNAPTLFDLPSPPPGGGR